MPARESIISQSEIGARVRELGKEISNDYREKELVVVGVLNGALIFMADLVRAINLDLMIDFIRAASYGDETSSCGSVRISKDIEVSVSGKDVLIVEDIIDSGRTLACLNDYFVGRQVSSVRTCAFISKMERRQMPVEADYIGFEVEKGFLVGYGLDCAGRFRNLDQVYRLREILE